MFILKASLKGGKAEETLTHEKRTFEAEDRDWSEASTSQGKPRIVSNPQNPEVREGLSLEPSERKQSSTNNLILDL